MLNLLNRVPRDRTYEFQKLVGLVGLLEDSCRKRLDVSQIVVRKSNASMGGPGSSMCWKDSEGLL